MAIVACVGVITGSCSGPATVCAGLERIRATLPDTTTIKVGAATIAIAGESYGACAGEPDQPPPRRYVWHVSDSSVVTVAPIDSIDARISGLRPGQAIVTPVYLAGGDRLSAVSVTVVP